MAVERKEIKNIKIIKEILNFTNYDIADFWEICPYNVQELKQSRHSSVFPYRHIGFLWYVLAGYTFDDTRKIFLYSDHTIGSHITKQITYTLQNNKFGNPDYLKIINELKEVASPVPKFSEIWVNYYAGLVFLENQKEIHEKLIK